MKIIRNPEFTAPVKVISPGEGGQREDQFKVRFRALTRSQEEEYDRSTAAGTDDFLRAVVIGWEGLKEDDGTAFEFSSENLNVLLDVNYIRSAIALAYFSAVSGIKAAKRGN